MRRSFLLVVGVMAIGIGALSAIGNMSYFQGRAQTKDIPASVTLAEKATLGQVVFNHADHTTKNYNQAGDGPIACTECHHTAQPQAEVAKHALWKTSYPADRTTTLTKDLYAKDAAAAGAVGCRNCHVKAGETPKLLPKLPEVTLAGAATPTVVTNMVAFHRRCTACHTEIKKLKPDSKGPGAAQCTLCHKKAA